MLNNEIKEYEFLFSIVMAIYNVEEYLEEAIESIINQTLDFRRHVQLILVNDGSPDNSESVCLKYKEMYPKNVRYISKENGGVSSARNEGLKYVEGKYVNFLDPDDKLSKDTLYNIFIFFEKNYYKTDIVSIPITFFEAREGPHNLNYKFSTSQVVNLLESFDYIQLSSASAFFKSSTLKLYRFNNSMNYAEDAELINKILLEKCTLGVLKEGEYYYRIRNDYSSAIQNGKNRKEWYTEYLNNLSLSLINYALTKLNYVPSFIQYLIMYDLTARFNVDNNIYNRILNEIEKKDFKRQLGVVLKYIDDQFILKQRDFNIHRKIFALRIKYGQKFKFEYIFSENNVEIYWNHKLLDSLKNQIGTISILEIKPESIYIEGMFGSLFNIKDLKLFASCQDNFYEVEFIQRKFHNIYSLDEIVKEYFGFKIEIPISIKAKKQTITFFISYKNNFIPIRMNFKRITSKLSEFTQSYHHSYQKIIYYYENSLIIEKSSVLKLVKKEYKFIKELISSNQVGAKKAVVARLIVLLRKNLAIKKPIWLFLDRNDKADDNAEYLFRYAIKQKDGVKKYYVIKKESEDYSRLKKIGPVVAYGSYKHKILHLLSKKVISSHAESWIDNPFFSLEKYYRDLFCFQFIFLQHGVIVADVSKYLNKFNRNFKFFATSSAEERNSILTCGYGFNEDEVKLTGLPRYDYLENRDKKQIIIMLTWRNAIVGNKNLATGTRGYSNLFKKSLYYEHLNSLINDERLISTAKQNGYKVIFVPHPEIRQQLNDFDKNDNVKIAPYNYSYQKLFNESSLLITDYSSVAFDFAYLKKPVIYYQFDESNYDDGYFDYNTMGFGDVYTDYESLINNVVKLIKEGCKMDEKYIDRVNSFFCFTDQNNCYRVYNEVKNK